jgi:hypothetical protein
MVLHRGSMRALLVGLVAMTGCALAEGPDRPPTPTPLDRAWGDSMRRGDVVVLMPGTGVVDYVPAALEAMGSPHPRVNVRDVEPVRVYSSVFEQAIASAERAGFTHEDIEGGALTFLVWGAGFTNVTGFDYVSFDGVTLRVDVLGGTNSCAVGGIVDNYVNYSATSADVDARDLYTRLHGWLRDHSTDTARNVTLLGHSWGGAVAEYLTMELDTIDSELGPLYGGARIPFTVATGVPKFVLGYAFLGPRVLDYDGPGGARLLFEIDRPDDPVHALTFDGNFSGHHYPIVVGDEFLGFYGITTDELACDGVAGACN